MSSSPEPRLAVLLSGGGSNLQAIVDCIARGELRARVVRVLSDNPDAFGLQRARRCGIPAFTVAVADYPDRASWESALAAKVDEAGADLIVLAGFMRVLGAGFVNRYPRKILNIHPSLLPRHKGLNTHRRALEAGDARHGATVHFVTAEVDGGPVIVQGIVAVEPGDTVESLRKKVQQVEHRIYSEAIALVARGKC
ncbi:MAG: phosphoribosylglycinamide formyltransferase [Gammaproteobacteria bacterium]|nr:phosphoribosylglycinamide formyltransferase [Gammaproteobacteria bacterium]MDD9799071.1 phosphoribosylglycinamide formyltransferase [Gammaproteobacteria bacterium]MDD9871629.1 phosphoribosylglycinamide formyltransferase [Gammaproteobacteria bacterium]